MEIEQSKQTISDDVATADVLEAIRDARSEYNEGTTVSHEAVNWD